MIVVLVISGERRCIGDRIFPLNDQSNRAVQAICCRRGDLSAALRQVTNIHRWSVRQGAPIERTTEVTLA
jgi:hypothetical protein